MKRCINEDCRAELADSAVECHECRTKQSPITAAIVCRNCSAELEPSWTICPECQTPVTPKCKNCGTVLKPHWPICPKCQTPVVPNEERTKALKEKEAAFLKNHKTIEKLLLKLRPIIAGKLELDEKWITLFSQFKDDLGADSLDMYELTYAVEEDMQVEIIDEEAMNFITVYDVLEFINDRYEGRNK